MKPVTWGANHLTLIQAVAGLILLMMGTTSLAQSSCDNLLAKEFADKVKLTSQNQMASSLSKAFCSDETSLTKTDNQDGFKLLIPVDNIPLGFEGQIGHKKLSELKKSSCSSSNQQFSGSELYSLEIAITSKDMLDAWVKCLNREQRGVIGEIESQTDSAVFTFRARWAPEHPGLDTPQVTSFVVDGANCTPTDIFSEGSHLSLEWHMALCKRSPSNDVTIVLNTTMGSVANRLNAVPVASPAPPPLRERCLKGDMMACKDFIKALPPPECDRNPPWASASAASQAAAYEYYLRCQGNAQAGRANMLELIDYIISLQTPLMRAIQDIDKPFGEPLPNGATDWQTLVEPR